MAFPERRTVDVLLTILLVAGVCAAIYGARRIILIFVFAVLFAYLINPAVKFLQRHSLLCRNLRAPAVIEVYLAFVILIAVVGYRFAPGLIQNTVKAVDEVPALMDGLSTGDIATQLRGKYGWSEKQEFRLRAFLARHKDNIQGLVQSTDRFLSNTAQLLGSVLLIPVLAIFFLRDGDLIADTLIRLFISPERRPKTRALANDLHVMLTEYIKAQVFLCSLSLLFYLAALILLRFPHALALSVGGGLLEFLPALGWISTFAVIVGVGVVNHLHWIWMAALLGLWRVIQDYFVTPRIMGNHLKLHPLATIFALLVGAEIGGIVGIYLAIPFMASLRVICCARGKQQNGQGADHSPEATLNASPCVSETATA
jgi:predicted PurR-regulated permease PerM